MRSQWLRDDRKRIASRVLALLGVLGLKFVACEHTPNCAQAVEDDDLNGAFLICREEYLATRDPWTGVRYANQWQRMDPGAARVFVENLVGTPAQSDALHVLGKIAKRDAPDKAQALFEDAHVMHIAEARYGEAARDNQQLADFHRDQKRFAAALVAVDNCISEARSAHAGETEGLCHMTGGMVLNEIGRDDAAVEQFRLAEPLIVSARRKAFLKIEEGNEKLHNGFGPLRSMLLRNAILDLEDAIRSAIAASDVKVQLEAELNLIYALAELSTEETGRAAEAASHLEIARKLDITGEGKNELIYLEARIAYRRGDYKLARSLDAAVFDKLVDDREDMDILLRIAIAESRMAIAMGLFDDAVHWSSRAVEIAEPIRTKGSAMELRPWILSARREAYELLFVAHVLGRDLADAVVDFDHWQARTLFDKLARGTRMPPTTLRAEILHAEDLRQYVPSLSQAPVVQPVERGELLVRLDKVDLIALAVADDKLWRIAARHGSLEITEIGPVTALRAKLDEFRNHPTDSAVAEELGEKLLGSIPFRKTDETLYVLLDGGTTYSLSDSIPDAITQLPAEALRRHGELLTALRPVVRPARLTELGCVPALRPGHTRVIADVAGNLEYARKEAIELAASTGATPALGESATSEALFAAQPNDHMHIAVHTSTNADAIKLHDKSVSALEIFGRHDSPALVFLAACQSAAAAHGDSELASALATAFLASGSQQVIATLRPVRDPGAAALAHLFYAGGGIHDPARALAHARAKLSETDNTEWPSFILYGHDICREETR